MELEIKFLKNFQIEANTGTHKIKTDQSTESGGNGEAPNPYEYFIASVGLCAAHYINSFCKQRNIPVDEINIKTKIIKDPASGKFTIRTNVKLPTSFPEKYREAVIKAAEGCTVKKIVQSCPEFEIVLE